MSMLLDHALPADHRRSDTHFSAVGGHLLTTSQDRIETQTSCAGGDRSPAVQVSREAHESGDGGQLLDPSTTLRPNPTTASGWVELRIAADLFHRAQQERIAVANVIRRPADGGNVDPMFFAPHLERLEAVEHEAKLLLGRVYRRVVPPELRAWQADSPGVGPHLFARLLGHLGDPCISTPHYWEGTGTNRTLMVEPARLRTVGQLWQYCGHGAPARRTRGMSADDLAAHGSPLLKMLVHLNAEACMKRANGTRYRDVYVSAREAADGRLHTAECVRCGPSGRPARPGSPWSNGHAHAHALRIVGKELLRDMWISRHAALAGVPS